MAKGFEKLDSDLEEWLKQFPEKGFLVYPPDPQIIRKAIENMLICDRLPYTLTKKGKNLHKNLISKNE